MLLRLESESVLIIKIFREQGNQAYMQFGRRWFNYNIDILEEIGEDTLRCQGRRKEYWNQRGTDLKQNIH